MRTRFLNNDYFTLPPETFSFLHLPVPHLPPPPPSAVHQHLHFDSPLPDVSLNIDPLPIDAALSSFLSAVIPHRIHVDAPDLAVPNPDRSSSFAASVDYWNREREAEFIFEDHVYDADIDFHKESKALAASDENEVVYEPIQFETPEMDARLENVCFTEKERMQMMSKIPEVENSPEMLNPEPSRQYPYEALQSVSRVEDPVSEYLKGDSTQSLEENISIQHLPGSGKNIFLIFEAEESLGVPTCLSMVEIADSYFQNTRPQNFDERCQSIAEGKELLGSVEHEMLKLFSDECVSKKSFILSDLFPERDFINMLESEHMDRIVALDGTSLADSSLLEYPVTFQEFVFLDQDMIHTFEAFYDTKASDDLETSDWMSMKEFNFKSFNELIVCNEMALFDDTFKSLPVPVISDCKKMVSIHDILGEIFSNMKTQPLSASDGIYLNWDLLEEDKCNYNVSNWYQNMWAKIDMNNHDFGGRSFDDGKLVFDLVFCDDTIGECGLKQSEELQKLLSDCNTKLDNQPVEFGVRKLLDYGSSNPGCLEQLHESNAERASLLFKSMSEISNLDYFLNPQKVTVKGNCNIPVESTNANVYVPKVTATELKAGQQSRGWHTILHRVKLSDNIVALTRYFEKSYVSILQSDTELTKTHKSDVDYFELLSLQKHKLIEYHVNGNNMVFTVLNAVKQAAWYLCFYGLNPAWLYVDKLCQNSDYLKSRLGVLQSLIKDENRKMESNITTAHPSLSIVEEILQSNIKQNGLKALIVAEEVFWWSLKNILHSLGLSVSDLNNSYRTQLYANDLPEDMDNKVRELLISDCLLASYEHVSSLFPFNKFGIVLEYGGPYGSSRISELTPDLVGLPHLHFLTVELGDHSALKALCEGVEMPPKTDMLPETETPLIFNHKESMVKQKLERLLNFYPVEQSYDIKSLKVAPEADYFGSLKPSVKTEQGNQSLEPFPGSVIIVNTQNIDKEMIVSRRSSYQVILAMEKGGIQVVERDLHLPVDIILSSAVCLTWYNSQNLGKKATPLTGASSSLPFCIENIATDVLTLLSFYFCGCFLVFEGEFNFLSTVMESSDGLYAAAASLGIDLQIFFSSSPELTNEVIISCIRSSAILTSGLYSKMPDSVTLGESFLTQFPGINPLTAHSILSSGATLQEFLAWSHDQRKHVLLKYHVPEESLSLFSVFCRYGEREDSKSIMTDCSSSVSSGPDSDKSCFYQVGNKRKRKYPVIGDQKDELCLDELLQFETLSQVVDAVPDSSTLQKSFDPGMSKDARRSRDLGQASLYKNDLFYQKQENIAATMRNPSRVALSSWDCRAPQISEQLEQPSLSLKNKELAQNEIMDTELMGKSLNWHNLGNFEKLQEDVRGEVVDWTDSPLLDENCFNIPDSRYFPNLMTETEKDHARDNKIARRLSFNNNISPATKSSKLWRSMTDTGEVDDYAEPDFGKDIFPLFNPRENTGSTQDAIRNLRGLPFQEGPSHLSETPLSRARQSAGALNNNIRPATKSSKLWRSITDTREVDEYAEPDFGKDVFPLFEHRENTGSTQDAIRNLRGLPFQEGLSHLSETETPLSRARQSAGALKHSPWTTEFINKVKEKSKLRQKSLLCGNISSPIFGYPGNMSTVPKRRSPSILDSFRYQPSRTMGNMPEQKRQKQSGQSSNSVKKGRYPAPTPLPSRTPNDKRSTKTLTFGKCQSGTQTRLVWSDRKKLSYQLP